MARPSKYEPEFAEQALKLCTNGATIREVAEFFEINETTVRNWSHQHVEFFTALKTGRESADIRVEQSLYRRAVGYSFDAVKIVANKGEEPVYLPYVEHAPPDVTAAIFWLKNRRPQEWRDVKAIEHRHSHVLEISDAELALIATASGDGASEQATGPQEPPPVH